MKVVILAAGKGTRLGDHDIPKPLTMLANGKSILQQQIDNILPRISPQDIHVVVGFRKELIMKTFPDLQFVYNANYANENTSQSLLKAFQHLDDDVLWLNGDVVFHPSILPKVISLKKTAMVVNKGPVGEEEVKYRTDAEGRIAEISKTVHNAEGEALGINVIQAKDLEILKRHLEKCQSNDYFEKGIETAIQEGLQVWPIVVGWNECAEVDYPEDLVHANQLLMSWGQF